MYKLLLSLVYLTQTNCFYQSFNLGQVIPDIIQPPIAPVSPVEAVPPIEGGGGIPPIGTGPSVFGPVTNAPITNVSVENNNILTLLNNMLQQIQQNNF